MAYWFKCQHCGQWSASAARLAVLRDKSCPYCGSQLLQENESTVHDDKKSKEENE